MSRENKEERQTPNIVVFLVEGESDRRALEIPLSELIFENHPDYEVRFLLQQKLVNNKGEELEDLNDGSDEEIIISDDEYRLGGDITSSSYVTPTNIEVKITNRFIKPAIIQGGLYPKRIAKIIQIVDLDGAYIPDENIVLFTEEHFYRERYYYDAENGRIETGTIDGTISRNDRKRKNIDYLLSLTEKKIKVKSKRIPYEIYYFSSNLEHFINHDANVSDRKVNLADDFLRQYGFDTEDFCSFFLDDDASVGYLGYKESWDFIRQESNSVKRYTNIDCLIRKLVSAD